jgi:hypothetical protein
LATAAHGLIDGPGKARWDASAPSTPPGDEAGATTAACTAAVRRAPAAGSDGFSVCLTGQHVGAPDGLSVLLRGAYGQRPPSGLCHH